MKKFLLLLIIYFLISQSFEHEPNRKIEFKEIRNLDIIDDTTFSGNGTDPDNPEREREREEIKNKLSEEKKIKPTLLGFGDLKKNKTKDANNITLSIYFKNVGKGKNPDKIFLKYLFFTIILKKTKIRMLQEDDVKIRTLCANLNNDSLSKDIVEYKVNNDITQDDYIPDGYSDAVYGGDLNNIEDYDNFEINGNFQFLDHNDFIYDDELKKILHEHLKSGENAVFIQSKEDLKDLQNQNQTFRDKYLFFKVYDLTQLGFLYYKIKGFFGRDVPFEKEKLNFTYNQYSEKKYFEGTLEKIPDSSNNYTLTFRIKDFIDTNLDEGCTANISQYKITKQRRLEEEYLEELVLFATDPDILRLDETSPEVSHNFGRKIASSSGLSGGAIAGIVIACVVALVGVALAFIYFNKPNIKPTDASAIEFYNNNNSNVNSSIAVVQD